MTAGWTARGSGGCSASPMEPCWDIELSSYNRLCPEMDQTKGFPPSGPGSHGTTMAPSSKSQGDTTLICLIFLPGSFIQPNKLQLPCAPEAVVLQVCAWTDCRPNCLGSREALLPRWSPVAVLNFPSATDCVQEWVQPNWISQWTLPRCGHSGTSQAKDWTP